MAQEAQEEPWPVITKEERILHEILFFSQGPVDGYILGDEIRNLLLKSGLSLTTLSQLWDLADVTNDNVLNIHEFVLIMHLIRGVAGGRAVPKTLPRGLTPPKTTPQNPPPMTQQEKDAYLRVFQTLDNSRAGVLDDHVAAEMFLSSKLSPEILAQVWDLSDFNRDGKLNPEKFAIACHLLRYVKQGGSLDGPIDIFKYTPQHISPLSLLARKRRVAEYEEHKQRLMSLKERRKVQAGREARRLDLCKQKVQYLQQLSELLKNLNKGSEIEGEITNTIQKDMTDNTKQEEIALRLKKEHEKVRQETVKIILGEQKFNNDISSIKKDTDELNKRLLSLFTHATKDTDPFHQLYEHRREKRQGSTIKDLDKIDIYIPFDFSPFDLNISPETLPSGIKIISEGTNQKQSVVEVKSVIEDLKEFGEQFMDLWGEAVSSSKETTKEFEDDEIFKEVHDWTDDNWPSLDWSENGMLGITDAQVVELKQKLLDIREELQKLSSEGGRLVFRNTEDYYARKKAIEEEENAQKGRVQRRSVTERFRNSVTGGPRARDSTNRYSYSGERRSIADSKDATQLAREYRLRRRSQNFDSASSSPEILRNIERDRRLPRAYTDPASGSEEASLSRESSLSSIDQAVSLQGSSPKLEEESSTVRTHHSSKTDDSGISTFRSNTRKDDSCSESSFALSSIISDSAVTTVPPGRTKGSEIENKTSQTKQSQGEGLSSVSVEPKKEEKRPTNFSSVSAKDLDKPTLPETARNPLNKQAAIDSSSPVAPTTPSWDKSTEDDSILSQTLETHVKSTSLTTSAERHIQDTGDATALNNHKPNLVDEKPEEDTYIVKTETLPSRPPRVKKQSLTTETSKESSFPSDVTVAGDSVFAVKEIYISRTHDINSNPEHETLDKENVTRHTQYQLKSGSNTVKQAVDLISERSNRIVQQSSPNLNSSYDQNITEQTKSSEQRQKNKEPNTNEKTLVTQTSVERSKDKITGTYSENTLIGSCISETGPKGSHFPESKLKGSCLSETGHNETRISKTAQEKSHTSIKADVSNFSGVSMETLAPKFGDISDSDTEGGPPPLPDSAPPPLPAGQPPTTSDKEEAEEEVVTVEYTVPIAQINGDHSFSVYSTKTEKTSPESSVVSISPHTSGSIVHNEIDKAPQSTSKTISDLRSDFFGIKPRSSSTETTPDVTAVVVRESRDVSHVEAKISEKSSTSTPQPSDTTSIGAEKPSTGDTTKRTNPNDDHTRERTPSTEKKVVSSNDSIEPTLEISMASSISSSPPTVSQSKNLSSLPTNAESRPTIKKQSSSTERSVDMTVDINGSKKIDEAAYKVEDTTKKVEENAKKVEENAKKAGEKTAKKVENTSMKVEENAKKAEEKTAKKVENKAMKVEENVKKENNNTKKVEENTKKVEENPKKVNDDAKKVEENPAKDEISAELAKERRTVISESAVKRKIISSLTPSIDDDEDSEESLQNVGKSVKSSNPSEYGFVYSAERPVPPPEAFWSDKLGDEHKVNLYSQNVVKEGNTTESVDRESIADLVTTKRQWENIFTVQGSSPSDTSAKKKASPKWSVRLPYTERPSAPSTSPDQITEEADNLPTSKDESPAMFKKPVNTESAIEREIRLAHEREEMLRKELEDRLKLSEKPFVQSHQGQTSEKPAVQSHQGQSFIAAYTASNAESESFQPAYNELTEADRDPELWGKERNKIEVHEEESVTNGVEVNPNESIIEREIRLQREREAEVAKMRKTVFGGTQPQPVQEQHVVRHPEHHNHKQHEEQEEVSHNKTKDVVKQQEIVTSPQTVENLIARELQELKEREEEVKRLHVSIHGSGARSETTLQTAKNDASPKSPTKEGSWQRDVSPFILQPRRESIDSASSHSTGGRTPSDHVLSRRDVRVKPIADGHSDSEEQKPDYFQKQETPIEREMRVARERENELRKQKGLPELNHKEENPYGSYNTDHDESNNNDSVSRSQSLGQPENSMKKYASNRLQQELQQQKERELALRSEGKILTTSEEHIQPLKFIDIAGSSNNNEGASKRNFTTRKSTSTVTNNEPESHQVQQEILSPSGSGQPAKKAGATGAGGRLFSYREFKQSAESKIERELREMKEREEELRKQRTGCATEPAR